MKIWFERALAAIAWVGKKLAAFGKFALAKLQVVFNTIYDPPPKTIRFWFWSFAAVMLACWVVFAFTNSWFYRPTIQALSEFRYALGDDLDVVLPEVEPLPPVPTPAASVTPVEVVCHDMSDTPHCEPVPVETEASAVSVEEIPPPVAKPKSTIKKSLKVRHKKREPYVTYWGF